MIKSTDNPELDKLSDREIVELLKFYNLYAVSNGGDKNALVVPGKEMMAQIKKRLAPPKPSVSKPVKRLNPRHNYNPPISVRLNNFFTEDGALDPVPIRGWLSTIASSGLWPTNADDSDVVAQELAETIAAGELPCNANQYKAELFIGNFGLERQKDSWTIVLTAEGGATFKFTNKQPPEPSPNKLDII